MTLLSASAHITYQALVLFCFLKKMKTLLSDIFPRNLKGKDFYNYRYVSNCQSNLKKSILFTIILRTVTETFLSTFKHCSIS